MANNYTLGRGKVFFSLFKTGGLIPIGFLYIGNTPEFGLTIEKEDLQHFSSDSGVRELDGSVALQTTRTGSFVTDNISKENLANFFFGSSALQSQSAVTGQTEVFTGIVKGASYQIGINSSRPVGRRGITSGTFTCTNGSSTTYVNGTDYTLDAARGVINILSTGSIPDAGNITVNYGLDAKTFETVTAGTAPVEGALMYLADNPAGANYDYRMMHVKLTPNGDLNLKGDDWQQIPFSVEIIADPGVPAISVNGQPYTP